MYHREIGWWEPGSRSSNKTRGQYNRIKKAGADEVVACHDAGAQMMADKGIGSK